jgi:glucose/arabinose dehydrogenase
MLSVLPSRLRRWPLTLLGLIATLLFPASSAFAPQPPIQAHAPVEILATHLHAPTGLTRDPETGDLFVSEADTGVIRRLRTDAQGATHIETLATGFKRPRGLARDPRDGSLLVVDEKAGTLTRIALTGVPTLLRDDLKSPQWVVVADDGTVYVTAEEGAGFKLPGHEEGILLQLAPDGTNPQLVVKGLKRPAGLRVLPDGRVRFLADRWRREPERDGGTVFEYTPGDDTEVVVRAGFKRPHDLSLDRLEATYLTADRQKEQGHRDKGVIGKSFSGEGVALFATGLREPQGLVFDPQGSLYVAEADTGRILKFLAPRPPTLDPQPPSFTKEATLTLTGTAEPNALLTVQGATVPLPAQTDVSNQLTLRASRLRYHPRTELFAQTITLTNPGTTPLAGPLAVVVTNVTPPEATLANATTTVQGHPAVEVRLVERLLRPGETAQVVLQFRGLNPPQRLTSTREIWAGRPITVSDVKGRFSFPVTLTPNTETHLELFATAAFGLGLTSAPTNVTVVQDDQPPAVTITGGPDGEIGVPEATFTFTATDNLTPLEGLQFAWALDADPFTPFQAAAPVRLTALARGPHIFRVKARDQAGNETPTPAQRSFTVRTLRMTITEPSSGGTVAQGPLLVRGTVEAGGVEVGVIVNGFPASVQGTRFAVLVFVTSETTTLTAVATTVSGATTTTSINVSVLPTPSPAIILEAFPPGGAAPLTVTFHLQDNTGRSLMWFELDVDGNGSSDFASGTFNEPQTTYTRQGLFVARLRATDDPGQVYTATTLVNVGGMPALEPKWEGMKDALRRGDIPAAVAFIHSTARDRYEAIFRRLTPSQLASIDQYLTTLVPVQIGHNGAELAMRRTRGGELLSFPVWFQVDTDGIWRLRMF